MSNEAIITNDLNISSSWVEQAKSILKKNFLRDEWDIIKVEGEDNTACKILDMSCGIDYLLTSSKSSLIFGIASRVQYGQNYRTFTVRKSRESGVLTEYQKRQQAISLGGIFPKFTMQAYVKDNEIDGLAIVKTNDLIEFINRGYAEEKSTRIDKIGQATFYVCKWDNVKFAGYDIKEFQK